MMSNYVVCEEPEHDRFGHRRVDCTECTPVIPKVIVELQPNPRIGQYSGIGRAELVNMLIASNNQITELKKQLAEGLRINGWWCICDSFNGEEREIRTECRSCGKPKTVRK